MLIRVVLSVSVATALSIFFGTSAPVVAQDQPTMSGRWSMTMFWSAPPRPVGYLNDYPATILALAPDSEGGFAVATRRATRTQRIEILRIDAAGRERWSYGHGYSGDQLAGDARIAVGQSGQVVFCDDYGDLVALDAAGNLIWRTSTKFLEDCSMIAILSDGSVVAGGGTLAGRESHGATFAKLVNISSTGQIAWRAELPFPADYAWPIWPTILADESLLVTLRPYPQPQFEPEYLGNKFGPGHLQALFRISSVGAVLPTGTIEQSLPLHESDRSLQDIAWVSGVGLFLLFGGAGSIDSIGAGPPTISYEIWSGDGQQLRQERQCTSLAAASGDWRHGERLAFLAYHGDELTYFEPRFRWPGGRRGGICKCQSGDAACVPMPFAEDWRANDPVIAGAAVFWIDGASVYRMNLAADTP